MTMLMDDHDDDDDDDDDDDADDEADDRTNDQPELCRWGSGYALLPDTHQSQANTGKLEHIYFRLVRIGKQGVTGAPPA